MYFPALPALLSPTVSFYNQEREPVTIGYQDVIDGLHKAVIDRGFDYVYVRPTNAQGDAISCVYFDKDTQPSCLVGHLLSQVGVAPFPFGSNINTSGVAELFSESVLTARSEDKDRIMAVLAAAQMRQDQGDTWGEAVDLAMQYYDHQCCDHCEADEHVDLETVLADQGLVDVDEPAYLE